MTEVRCRPIRYSRSRGFFAINLLGAFILATGVAITLGYNVMNLLKSNAKNTRSTLSGYLMTQAAQMLHAEASDSDSDGYPESTAGAVAYGDGWNIPTASGAPKNDAWGTAIRYCPWDNGTINSSTGRLTGDKPGTQGSIVFAIISAGADKSFSTTCAQAKTGVALGDDLVHTRAVAEIVNGVGGSVYFGDPVADMAALAALNTAALVDHEARLVLSTGVIQYWSASGAKWSAAQ